MKKKILIVLSYIILFFNSNLLSNEENKILKIGLLAPLSGEYEELGNSLLYSLQLALREIDDKNVIMQNIIHYNQVDCKVLWEIISYLRS